MGGFFGEVETVGFSTWVFPKIGVPQNGWFIMEDLIKMDDLGVPLFLETPMCFINMGCCREFYYVLLGDVKKLTASEKP